MEDDKVPEEMTVCVCVWGGDLMRAWRPQGSFSEEVMFELRPVGEK